MSKAWQGAAYLHSRSGHQVGRLSLQQELPTRNTCCFLLVLLQGSGTVGLMILLDTAPRPSTAARTLNMIRSYSSTGGAGMSLLVQEVTSSQPSALKEPPFPSPMSTNSSGTAGCSDFCLEMVLSSSFSLDLELQSLLTFSFSSLLGTEVLHQHTPPASEGNAAPNSKALELDTCILPHFVSSALSSESHLLMSCSTNFLVALDVDLSVNHL